MPHLPPPITSPFGPRARGDGFHDGVDDGTKVGTVLGAPWPGLFTRGDDPAHYGWYATITRADGREMLLGHLSAYLVDDGDMVLASEPIVRTGGAEGAPGAGNSTGPHVHVGVKVNGAWVDPVGKVEWLFHPGEAIEVEGIILIQLAGQKAVYAAVAGAYKVQVADEDAFKAMRFSWSDVHQVGASHRLWKLPTLNVP